MWRTGTCPRLYPFACPSRLANEILAGLFLPLCAPMFFRARSVTSVHNPRFGYCLHDVSVRYLNALIVSSPSTYVPFRAGRFHAWSALRFHLTFGKKKKKGNSRRSCTLLLSLADAHARALSSFSSPRAGTRCRRIACSLEQTT